MYGEKKGSTTNATADDDEMPKLYGSIVRWRSTLDKKDDAREQFAKVSSGDGDEEDDLVGGETYFELIEMGAKHHKVNPEPFGNGDIIMYDESMFHGVKQVLSGRRLVLVTWFKKR